MIDTRNSRERNSGQRKAVRTAVLLAAVAVGIYVWAIVSHL